jgi:hypothetical protein
MPLVVALRARPLVNRNRGRVVTLSSGQVERNNAGIRAGGEGNDNGEVPC